MRWADRHGISYLGWAWDAHGGWTCRGGPSLIKSYEGTPTAFGRGFHDHLRALAAPGTRRGRERSPPLGSLLTMDDQQALDRIDELVKEEEDLLHRHEGEGLDDDEHARLQELKLQLDKTWDYLRQRRSLREAGDNPDDASMRDGGTVEDYGKVTPYDDTEGDAPE